MINILYIHGFMSSPQSYKTSITGEYIAKHFPRVHYYCPQLDVSPAKAINQLTCLINEKPTQQWLLIGSSLGGFYATYLLENAAQNLADNTNSSTNMKAVLINPAVQPYLLLADYIGPQKSYHSDQVFDIKESFLDELKALEKPINMKKNYLVMVQTGDEVLNYQDALTKYQQCECIVQQGGDHSFIDYPDMLSTITRFFNLTPNNLAGT